MHVVKVAPDAEDVALAVMLADLIRANLEQKPERVKDFMRLKGKVNIAADDADVGVTFEFNKGALTVKDGLAPDFKLQIVADSSTLMDLANVTVKFGMPWFFDKTGFAIQKKLLKRELQIAGLLTHTFMLMRLSKVISVA
jgi:hypothetical protein